MAKFNLAFSKLCTPAPPFCWGGGDPRTKFSERIGDWQDLNFWKGVPVKFPGKLQFLHKNKQNAEIFNDTMFKNKNVFLRHN